MEGGRLAVATLLLQHSANTGTSIVESKTAGSGWTPLIKAAFKGYVPLVKVLLEFKADVNAQGRKGFSALIAAAQVF